MAVANPQPVPVLQMNYWIRLAVGSECYLKKAVRCVLHNTFNSLAYTGIPGDPDELFKELKKYKSALSQLKTRKLITSTQWKLLYPTNKLTSSKQLDIPLMVILLEHCTNLKPPVNGWHDSNPSLSDQELAANCLRARNMRHFLYHYGNPMGMRKAEFLTKWDGLDQILTGLGYKCNTLVMKTGPLDPHRMSYFNCVTTYLEEGQKKLLGLHEGSAADVENLMKRMLALQDNVTNISHLETDIINIISDYETLRRIAEENNKLIEVHDLSIQKNKDNIAQVRAQITESNNRIADTKAKIEDLATHLDTIGLEKGAFDGIRWNIHEIIPDFYGRVTPLHKIHQLLSLGARNVHYTAVAISGLGGIGKTEVAAKYVQLHETEFDNIIWLECNDLTTSLVRLASFLKVNTHVFEIDVLTQAICDKLKSTKCLFVLNDTINHDSIKDFLRNLKSLRVVPHVIITTEYSHWDGSMIKHIRLKVFTKDEAAEFLMMSLPQTKVENVYLLVHELQALPLALQQAKCYMKKHSMNIEKYIEYFKQSREELWNAPLNIIGGTDYDKTLLTVWKMAYDKLSQHKNSIAIEILRMMAYMDGRCINAKTFLYIEEMDELKLNGIIEFLSEYSLIHVNSFKMISIHNLVQKMVQSYNEGMFDSTKLSKLLMKIAENKGEGCDSDPENLWFIHMKKLLATGYVNEISLSDASYLCCTGLCSGDTYFVSHINLMMLGVSSLIYKQSGEGFFVMVKFAWSHSILLCHNGYYTKALRFMNKMSNEFEEQLLTNRSVVLYWFYFHVYVLVRNGKISEAETLFDTLSEPSAAHERYTEFMISKTKALFDLKRTTESLTTIDNVLKHCNFNLEDIPAVIEICSILLTLNDAKRAIVCLEKLQVLMSRCQIQPTDVRWFILRFYKAQVHEMNKRYDEGLKELKQCLDTRINNRFAIISNLKICRIYFKMEDFDASKSVLFGLLEQPFEENCFDLLAYCKCYLAATLLYKDDIETAKEILMNMKDCHINDCADFSNSYVELIDTFMKLKISLVCDRKGDNDEETVQECIKFKDMLNNSFEKLPNFIW